MEAVKEGDVLTPGQGGMYQAPPLEVLMPFFDPEGIPHVKLAMARFAATQEHEENERLRQELAELRSILGLGQQSIVAPPDAPAEPGDLAEPSMIDPEAGLREGATEASTPN
jgi:hypothetical protein